MSSEQIKKNLRELQHRLEQVDPLDDELQGLLTELDEDLHRLLGADSQAGEEQEGLQERLESLAADFDTRHPQLSAVLRELGDALARVGI